MRSACLAVVRSALRLCGASSILVALWGVGFPSLAGAGPLLVKSPNGKVRFELRADSGKPVTFEITLGGKPVIENSAMSMIVDGSDLAQGAAVQEVGRYQIRERY